MKMNIGIWDQAVRLIFGGVLIVWGVAGGPWWAHVGLVLIATAAWRFDPFYALLRVGTARTQLLSNSAKTKLIPTPRPRSR